LAKHLGVADRVRFLGAIPHENMREIYSAADALVLASNREGWPNVLLEAMACGTPVVASNIWGNPEIVADPVAGRILARREPDAVADAVRSLLADPPARSATRAYAERFGWEATTQGQLALFRRVLGQDPA
jgi:glycosyltransferase involved in cell wall biosynthesis